MRYEGFRTLVTLGLILFTAGLPGFTQTPGETEARVPALDSFHEVIFFTKTFGGKKQTW